MQPCYRTALIALFYAGMPQLWAQQESETELPFATIGMAYAQSMRTDKPARFSEVKSNAKWLRVTPEGVLIGTPDEHAPQRTEITVEASWGGHLFRRSFVVPVDPSGCPVGRDDVLRSCNGEGGIAGDWRLLQEANADAEGDKNMSEKQQEVKKERFAFTPQEISNDPIWDLTCPETAVDGCIVQFDRLHGNFGHFIPARHKIWWNPRMTNGDLKDYIVNAINASKVFISGSVVIRRDVHHCPFLLWSAVTQTTDSSNNLVYEPSDVSAFCVDDPTLVDGKFDDEPQTLLIVLPVHSIWANVYGRRAYVKDPTWRPASSPPQGRDCLGAMPKRKSPDQGIVPCDIVGIRPWRIKPISFLGWNYNRLAQPGVSQGGIGITSIAPATKSTWDVQLYESTLLGPGWLGFQFMYEHDRKPTDDLNSLTAALMYDVRFYNAHPYWGQWGFEKVDQSSTCKSGQQGVCTPPTVGIRPLEFSLRIGPEWSPDAFTFNPKAPPAPEKTPEGFLPQQYLPRDVNLVGGATLRLPIVLSPEFPKVPKRPSLLTVVPVAGLEGGFRMISHPIGNGTKCGPGHGSCASQPQEIFRRVAGLDASARWPYNLTHNFLGDRPLTVDYSYRMRWLSFAEPFANQVYVVGNLGAVPAAGQSLGGRSYSRVTFIAPFSAYLQLRTTWQHGALPPTFQFVGNEVTVGVTFSNPGSSEH